MGTASMKGKNYVRGAHPALKRGAWSLDVFRANSNEPTALPIETNVSFHTRMEMSTKRLFHYKQEMRASDW
ncbi:MAG: hypothetical protein DMG05_06425 [Acidobacteria bacterium]|nr:MAG: hypothetical protein DMG05_06425 [Acidobacteriota bacterium]